MFRWSEFLDIARRLRTGADNDEATLRTVVGRAYYSAFNQARDKAFSLSAGRMNRSGSVHEDTWSFYRVRSDLISRQVAQLGTALFRRRKDADYELRDRRWTAEADDAIEKAARIEELLAHLPS